MANWSRALFQSPSCSDTRKRRHDGVRPPSTRFPASRSPNHTLLEIELREVVLTQRQLAGVTHENLVELRRLHAGVRQHGVYLSAVVDLMLKQVQQGAVLALGLDPLRPHHVGRVAQRIVTRAVAQCDQTPVDGPLLAVQVGELGAPRRNTERGRSITWT